MPSMRSPTKLYLQVTNICDLECRQCYTRCGKTTAAGELSSAEWTRFIDDLEKNGVIQIYFEGGEPLLRPDFLELAAYTSQRMLVWFRTHGHLITRDVAAGIKAAGVGLVAVDVFAPDEETHDSLTGVSGSFLRTCEGVRQLRAAGLPVVLICIVNKLNVGNLQSVIELSRDLGVNKAAFFRLYPIGRARDNWSDLAPSLEEVMSAIRAVRVPDGFTLMQSWHPNDGNCCWENAGITSDGRSIGCPYLREFVDFGNIRETPFLATWENPTYRYLRTLTVDEGCPECAGNEGTSGGCRAAAFAFTGNWEAPDPYCERTNRGVDLTQLPPQRPPSPEA